MLFAIIFDMHMNMRMHFVRFFIEMTMLVIKHSLN